MEDLKLNQVVKLEERDLEKVRGGIQGSCGCGCAEFNGLDNSQSSFDGNKG